MTLRGIWAGAPRVRKKEATTAASAQYYRPLPGFNIGPRAYYHPIFFFFPSLFFLVLEYVCTVIKRTQIPHRVITPVYSRRLLFRRLAAA